MARHTLMVDPGMLSESAVGALIAPERSEGEHAVRVKRVAPGERVTLLDGAGAVGVGEVVSVRPGLEVRVESVGRAEPVSPRVEVWSATPKGPRLEDMIDQLSQAGAALWRPLETDFGVVEPGSNKMDRCRRVAREAAKQCGRAWVMEIGESVGFDEALRGGEGVMVVLADALGAGWGALADHAAAPDWRTIRVLVGPEGGFSPAELGRASASGVRSARFGPHVLRIETAAVCAAARIVGG